MHALLRLIRVLWIHYLVEVDAGHMSAAEASFHLSVVDADLLQHTDNIGPYERQWFAARSRNTEKPF